jgi:molecular chaperone DnaK
MTRLIERNTTIPTKRAETFSTAADNQTAVDIKVHQGERDMAGDNKLIGAFQLVGIPPAPRGIPQGEVTFDIDANGILSVSARDKATGKEQSIKIQASSGLSEEEIQRMVRDAESHADEDHRRRQEVETRNQAESLVYQVEKQVKENEGKLDSATKARVEEAMEKAKKALSGTDTAAVKAAADELQQVFHQATQQMYQSATGGAGSAGASPGTEGKGKEGSVDADYEVVD